MKFYLFLTFFTNTLLLLIKEAKTSDQWEVSHVRDFLNITHQIQLINYQRDNYLNTSDDAECIKLGVSPDGKVDLRLSCCISKGLMHKPGALVSVDPNRCQVFVCEKMVESDPFSVEIVTKSPVFRHSEAMMGCCYRSGVMYKPGASFRENGRSLACCSGKVYAELKERDDHSSEALTRQNVTTESSQPSEKVVVKLDSPKEEIKLPVQIGNRCPNYKCGSKNNFLCRKSSTQRFDLRQTQYAIFPTVLSDKGFSMNVFGAKDSLKRDCRGHFYLASNVKTQDGNIGADRKTFLGLPKKSDIQGFFVKFTPEFKQSWAVMIDLQEMENPIVKDLSVNSNGDVYGLFTYESSRNGKKVTVLTKYDSCGSFISSVDLLEGAFVSRDAYISIDSKDNALIVNSNVATSSEHPCRVYSTSKDFTPLWNVTIQRNGVSCLPTGIVSDCQDHVYVSGFFGSDRGFVKKLNGSSGDEIWSLDDEGMTSGQITDLVHDVAASEIIFVVNNAHLFRARISDGTILKSSDLLVKKLTILPSGEILAFVFSLEDRSHRLLMLDYDLNTQQVFDIPWNDWNSIAWCDNLVEDSMGSAVFLSCAMNNTHDIIIFRIEL